jgi:hypothetical protein
MQNASLLLGWVGPKPALLPFSRQSRSLPRKRRRKTERALRPSETRRVYNHLGNRQRLQKGHCNLALDESRAEPVSRALPFLSGGGLDISCAACTNAWTGSVYTTPPINGSLKPGLPASTRPAKRASASAPLAFTVKSYQLWLRFRCRLKDTSSPAPILLVTVAAL